jgi:YidC/Oxa1 family membrane protein insertase
MHPMLTATIDAAATSCPILHKAVGGSIFASIAKPIAAVLAGVYAVVPNYAVAILALSILWMVIIAPLTLKSTRSMLAMQRLQPQLKKLQAEHKNDRQAFAQAQMDLFKQHNVSPFGSCLPMLLPLPVFFALFRVIDGLSYRKRIGGLVCPEPNYLSPHTAMFTSIVHHGGQLYSLGLNLSKNALSSHASFLDALPYFLLLVVMIGTQYLQTVRMMSRNPQANDNPQAKFMKYLPIVFGVIFIRFPAGVILYYAMSNVCRIAQQEAMYLWDPKVKSLARKDIREVETEIAEIEGGKRSRARRGPAATDAQPPTRGSRFRDLLAGALEQQHNGPAGAGRLGGGGGRDGRSAKPQGRPGTKGGAPPAPEPGDGGGRRGKAQQRPTPATRGEGSGSQRRAPTPSRGEGKPRPVPTPSRTGRAGGGPTATPPPRPPAASPNGSGDGSPPRPAGARTGATRPAGSRTRNRKRRGR